MNRLHKQLLSVEKKYFHSKESHKILSKFVSRQQGSA